MFILSYAKDLKGSAAPVAKWSLGDVLQIFKSRNRKSILMALLVYWLVGEVAVVVIYFFAIMLKEYAGLSATQILIYTIVGQLLAIVSTFGLGLLANKVGGKGVLIWIVFSWMFVPVLLFFMSVGLTFWVPMGLSRPHSWILPCDNKRESWCAFREIYGSWR